ncbi:LysR family transcriptional regulator [Amycolatopsis sp. lyj-23]|uniref:LysR family transcriptional regulator n=1 Tax=Amycolatopsis sp. lyj-23 TaxID=2789283 RepID=UPI003978C1B3
MSTDLDLALLRTFVLVAQRGSMTSAGNVLKITQGAVSQQMNRLESKLGCTLFVRDRRGLRLTRDGDRLLGRAQSLLSLHDEIRAEMTTNRMAGRVRLGVPFDLVGTLLPPAISSFATDHPDVELSLACASSTELLTAVEEGTVDLAVVEVPVGSPARHLRAERLVWAGAPGGIAHRATPLPVSLVSDACAFRPLVLNALRAHSAPWRSLFENGTFEAALATARMDLAVTVALESCVPADLHVIPPGPDLPELPLIGVDLRFSSRPANAAVEDLAHRITETLTGTSASGARRQADPAECG